MEQVAEMATAADKAPPGSSVEDLGGGMSMYPGGRAGAYQGALAAAMPPPRGGSAGAAGGACKGSDLGCPATISDMSPVSWREVPKLKRQLRPSKLQKSTSSPEEVKGGVAVDIHSISAKDAHNIRSSNCYISLFIFLLALFIAVAGGLLIGLLGYHFSLLTMEAADTRSNQVILNGSIEILHHSQRVLKGDTLGLVKFVRLATINQTFSTSSEMRDALAGAFVLSWLPLLSNVVNTDYYGIFVSFCPENVTVAGRCNDWMVLALACMEEFQCLFYQNNDVVDPSMKQQLSVYSVHHSNNSLEYRFITTRDIEPILVHQEDTEDGYFISPEANFVGKADIEDHHPFAFRQQRKLGNSYLVTEVRCSRGQWFSTFDRSLQKNEKSYSMVSTGTGTVLAYGYGVRVGKKEVPCSAWFTVTSCDPTGAIDHMAVNLQKQVSSPWSSFSDAPFQDISFTVIDYGLVTVYQSFLRIAPRFGYPPQIYFAAYSTPLHRGLDRPNVTQLLMCIFIVILSVILLGGSSLFSIYQLRKSVELVSMLAVHIVSYDLEKMEQALNSAKYRPYCGDSLGYVSLRYEFFLILKNLRAYRPFLPQALLRSRSNQDTETADPSSTLGAASPQVETDREHGLDVDTGDLHGDNDLGGEDSPHHLGTWPSLHPNNDSLCDTGLTTSTDLTRNCLQRQMLRRANGTAMTVALCNLTTRDGGIATSRINHFIEVVLGHVKAYGGIAESIAANLVTVTFNYHVPTTRHQDRACRCAIAIRNSFVDTPINCVIAITSGAGLVGTCGTEDLKARVVTGEAFDLAYRLLSLHKYLGCPIVATSHVVHRTTTAHVPIDIVNIDWEQNDRAKEYILFEIAPTNEPNLPEYRAVSKGIFDAIRAKRLDLAALVLKEYEARHCGPVQWNIERLGALCRNNPGLVANGYRRFEVGWDLPEGNELMLSRVRDCRATRLIEEANSLSTSQQAEECCVAPGTTADQEVNHVRQRIKQEQYVPQFTTVNTGLFSVFVKPGNHRGELEKNDPAVEMMLVNRGESDKCGISGSNSGTQENQSNTFGATGHVSGTEPGGVAGVEAADVVLAPDPGPVTALVPLEEASAWGLPRQVVDVRHQVFFLTSQMLGKGQFGEVILAMSENGTFLATKVFTLEGREEDLVRELKTLMKLQHENIVAYDTCAIQDGRFFIFMDYAAVGSMRHLMSKLGRIPERAARRYARDILAGLEYLHFMKCVHCDIKPDNVLLSSDGTCKLGDFGTAALGASATLFLKGTPRYMAPEAVRGPLTSESDVYSFGLTLAHMVLGYSPWRHYDSNCDDQFLMCLMNDAAMAPELPCNMDDKELCSMIHRCCSRDPRQRPTAKEMLAQLT